MFPWPVLLGPALSRLDGTSCGSVAAPDALDRGLIEEPVSDPDRSSQLRAVQSRRARKAEYSAEYSAEKPTHRSPDDRPAVDHCFEKAWNTGYVVRIIQGEVEHREHAALHVDQQGAKQGDAPVAGLQPALAPDPEGATRTQANPARKRSRARDALDGEDAVDGQDHVVVLGQRGEGTVHLVDAVLDLRMMVHVECPPDVLVPARVSRAKAGCRHGQPALDGLAEVGDVDLELAGGPVASCREHADGPRMEGVEAPAPLRRLDGEARHIRAREGGGDRAIKSRDSRHAHDIVDRVKSTAGVRIANISDRTFLMHLGGKIEIHSKVPIRSRDDLSMAYTPGVARVCLAIKDDPSRAFTLTIKQNAVAVVTDGTAVLGLGDIGPEAAMAGMEGQALLFKELAGVDAFPIPLATNDPGKIVETVKMIAPASAELNREDISAPRCFEVEERLRKELDIPVFHDDQHGTAVVVLAALLNALKIVRKDIRRIKVVVSGVGAAGTAPIKILLSPGARQISRGDGHGTIYRGRPVGMDFMKTWVAAATNPRNVKGRLSDAIRGADGFIGLSVPRGLAVREAKSMAPRTVVFARAS